MLNGSPTLPATALGGQLDRFNFAPFTSSSSARRSCGFISLTKELGENANCGCARSITAAILEPAAPLPLFVGPDAGNGNRLDCITIDATNPFNPFGTLQSGRTADCSASNGQVANYAFIGRRVVENGPRRYDQSVDTYYVAATVDGSFQWLAMMDWDVTRFWGRNRAEQESTAYQRLDLAQACRSPMHCALRAVKPSAERARHAAMLNLCLLTSATAAASGWDFSPTFPADCSSCPAAPQASPSSSTSRPSGRFDPILSSGRPWLRHPGAAHHRRLRRNEVCELACR